MTLRRRTVLQAVAAGAAVPWLPAFAKTGPHWVLAGGLATDAAFMRGAAAPVSLSLAINVQAYGALVATLARPGQQVLALLDAPRALLLEQALRDSGARLEQRHAVLGPSADMADAWAQALGAALATGHAMPDVHSFHGETRIAIVART